MLFKLRMKNENIEEVKDKYDVYLEKTQKLTMLNNVTIGILMGTLSLLAYESSIIRELVHGNEQNLLYISAISYLYSMFSIKK